MKRHSFSKGAYLLLLTLASCTSNLEEVTPIKDLEEIKKVTVTLPEINVSNESRIAIQVGSGVNYIWEATDTLGIFPNQGYQVAFPLNASSNSNSATFEGGGWGLLANSEYAAYYPFRYNNQKSDRVPITYLGQKQTGNKNTSYADSYNYMVSRGSKPVGGTLNFTMQFLGRLIILKFNVPEPTTLSSVKLIAPENVFTTKGYFNLWEETPSIVSTETSNSLTIELEDITTTSTNEEVTVYFFMAPVDLSGKTLTIEATDTNGNKISSTVAGKDITESKAYALTGSSTEIHVETAGTLSSLISNKYSISNLKITGELNSLDISTIRDMAGKDYNGNDTNGTLKTLDLSEASIVTSSAYYSQAGYSTSENMIGPAMFLGIKKLEAIILPKNITHIGKNAFYGCTNLTYIDIPNATTKIGERAFEGCTNLSSINLPNQLGTLEAYAFKDCSNLSEIEIPDGLTSINNGVFENCTNLTKIILHDNVTSIGNGVFSGCSNIVSIDLPDLNSIGDSAFKNCTQLNNINLPNSITNIGGGAFEGCSNLSSIKLPNELTTLNKNLFYGCTSLTNIELPERLMYIEDYAFYNCKKLDFIYIPDNVTYIKSYAFYGCESLVNIILPDGIKYINDYTFTYCKSLKQIHMPKQLIGIGNSAFYGCTSIKSINLPENLSFDETTDTYIFAFCTALNNVNISSGIKVIPQDMFRGCTSLKQITIPTSVTTIGGLAFFQSGLENVYIYCTTPPNMTTSFYEIPTSCKLYVPKGYSNVYTNSSNWKSSFSQIIEM